MRGRQALPAFAEAFFSDSDFALATGDAGDVVFPEYTDPHQAWHLRSDEYELFAWGRFGPYE